MIKIVDIRVVPVQAPGRTLVPVVVETDAGFIGVGEAGLQRRWKAIEGAVEHLKKWLVGQDVSRIEYLWQRMFRGGFYPGDRLIGSAISGIDIALWDIKGQVLGAPVFELLGGRCRDYVPCFFAPGYLGAETDDRLQECCRQMTSGIDRPEAAAEAAKICLANGHKFFRLAPNMDGDWYEPREAARRLIGQLRAAREAVGHRLELMVDLHGRLDPSDAIWFCREAEELNLFAVEDPIRSEHIQGYRQIRKHTNVPLAAGEQWAHKWEFRQAIEEELVDFVRPDLCICGGLSEGRKIAAMAEAHLIRLLPHNPLGPICTAASLHLGLACANAGPQEVVFPPADMLPDVFHCAIRLEGINLAVPNTPGLGVRFDEEAARKYPAEMTEPPHFRCQDGSFTNY